MESSLVLEAALRDGLTRSFAVDADIFRLHEFCDIIATVKVKDGAVDEGQLSSAIAEMQKLKPNLFAPPTPWGEIANEDEFQERDKEFRDSLYRPATTVRNDFKHLDSALLSHDEMTSLRNYLSGRYASDDYSKLRAALARQTAQMAILDGHDAA